MCVQDNFNYKPPCRATVMNALLDELYVDAKKKVLDVLNFADFDSLVTLSMDGWKAPTGQHIRNYMLVSDEITFFWTATNAGIVRPTGENIGKEACDVIKDVGEDNVAAVTNDNAQAETTSWEYIRNEYPTILCTGCTTHGGSLLFKDACDFPWAKNLIDKATTLATFFKNHQYTAEEVRRRSMDAHNKPYCIILPPATRFAYMYYVMKRLILLKSILREIAVSAGFEQRNFRDQDEIHAILNSSNFWRDLEKLRLFLKPLKCFIKLMDHDCHCTHHEYNGKSRTRTPTHKNSLSLSYCRYVDRWGRLERERRWGAPQLQAACSRQAQGALGVDDIPNPPRRLRAQPPLPQRELLCHPGGHEACKGGLQALLRLHRLLQPCAVPVRRLQEHA